MYRSTYGRAELTDEGRVLVDAARDDWAAVGSSVEACDRPAAEEAVAAAYRSVGVPVPEVVIWADSPFGGMVAAYAVRAHLSAVGVRALLRQRRRTESVEQIVEQLPAWPDARDEPLDPHADLEQLRSALIGAYYGSRRTSEVLWSAVIPGVRDALGAELGELAYFLNDEIDTDYRGADLLRELDRRLGTLRSGPSPRVFSQLWDDLRHPRSVGWLADDIGSIDSVGSGRVGDPDALIFADEFGGYAHVGSVGYEVAVYRSALAVAGLPPVEKLETYATALRSVGWFWASKDALVLTDRPVVLDGAVRAGAAQSDAFAVYADGYRVS